MKRPPRPGLMLVATREIRFFRRDHAGLFLLLAIPLIAFAVLAWTFTAAGSFAGSTSWSTTRIVPRYRPFLSRRLARLPASASPSAPII